MKTNIIKGRKQLRSYDIPVDVYDREVYLYIGQTMADACFGAESEFKEFDSNTKNGLVNLVSIYKTRLL